MDGAQGGTQQPPKLVCLVKEAAESGSAVLKSGSGFTQKQESDDKFASTQAQKVLNHSWCTLFHSTKSRILVDKKPCDFHLLRTAKSKQNMGK